MLHLTRSDGTKFYIREELLAGEPKVEEGRTRLQLKNTWVVYVTETPEEIERQKSEGCTYE